VILSRLAELFDLEDTPERIEVFDNSHISGTNPVGAMIVAGLEGFIRNQYRKFNIKSEDLAPGDDYAMMREMLTRRFSKLARDKDPANGWAAPDLVLIDGGPGQLSAAASVLDELGLSELTLCSSRAIPCSIASKNFSTRPIALPLATIARDARRRWRPLRSMRSLASDRRASARCSSISARPKR
jgi:excinuclease ABC subunit C